MSFDINVEQIRSNSAKGVEFQDSIQANAATVIAAAGAAETIDAGASNWLDITLTATATTLTATNVGPVQELNLVITGITGGTIVTANGFTITAPANGVTELHKLVTIDAGTTWKYASAVVTPF